MLVVDDQPLNRAVARAFLEHMGLGVREAGDGQEALRSLADGEAELVLLDIEMPGVDGLETLRRIRASEPLRRLPVVALTAHAAPGDERRFRDAGFDGYLVKPLDADGLGELLARLLEGT